jgi:L-fuculose-phosphate aldolase
MIDFESMVSYDEPVLNRGVMAFLGLDVVSPILRRAVLECVANVIEDGHVGSTPAEFFRSPAIHALKEEIVRTGKKLWERQYVDGNGGNISARISSRWVICTPTMCSKADVTADDISLVDLESSQICGDRPRTSEILLHLEIYKAIPEAKAVIHCHPPYATAHAIAGVLPQGNLLPEQEVFVGPAALTSYETPGTIEFARTILPVVEKHNTILLENHGVVSWADTITHAEWLIEVIETYCKTVMIARQLRSPLKEIPPEKIADLLAIKRKLGLPDVRYPDDSDMVEMDAAPDVFERARISGPPSAQEIDQLVDALALQVMDFLKGAHAGRG